MTLKGTFAADFTSFYDACSKAEVSLKDVESGAGKVGTSLNRMADSLSGRKLIADAALMSKAIEDTGGVSKLTGAELTRLGAKASEAAEKMQRLGIDVPANLQAVVGASRNVTAELENFGSSATAAGGRLTAALTLPIVGIGAAAIKMGIDATESRNLIEVSFGDMTKAADAWAAQTSKDFGLNRFETEKSAGVLFNMTTGMGLGRTAAFEMSTGVVKLAGDMASFRNIPMEEALLKIRSGLTGEAEPLKAIGILVDDATIKTYAYTHGIAAQGTELSAQQKVLARYGSIMAQTANDQGDLGRTLESPANQLRIMKERVLEATTALGQSLMPIVTQMIGWVAQLVPKVQAAAEWFGALPEPVKVAGVVLLGLVAAVGPVLVIAGQLAVSVAALMPLFVAVGVAAPPAAAGVASVGVAAGTAGTLMSTALLPAIAVIAAAFAGWKIGTWLGEATGLTDWVERTAGHMMGLSSAEIEAGMAARKAAEAHAAATPAITDMAVAAKASSDAMTAEAASQAAAAVATNAAAAAAASAKTDLKAYEGAMVEIASVGVGWKGTLDTISGAVVESIKFYLQAGVSQGALATAYGLTAAQVKSVASALTDEQRALKLEEASVLATSKLWEEFYADKVAHGGTANEAAIAQINKWAANLTKQMAAAGTDTAEFYNALAARSKQKMDEVGSDFDEVYRKRSIPAMREAAATALQTYNDMVSSGAFFREDLEKQRAEWEKLRDAARNFGVDAVAAQDAGTAATDRHTAALARQQNQMVSAGMPGINREPVSSQNFETEIQKIQTYGGLNPTGHSSNLDRVQARKWAEAGYSFNEILQMFRNMALGAQGPLPPPQGPRIPGFAGGVSNFSGGYATVGERGPETLYIPPGGSVFPNGSGMGGGTSVHVSMAVSGLLDPRTMTELTEKVSRELVQQMQRQGWRAGL